MIQDQSGLALLCPRAVSYYLEQNAIMIPIPSCYHTIRSRTLVCLPHKIIAATPTKAAASPAV